MCSARHACVCVPMNPPSLPTRNPRSNQHTNRTESATSQPPSLYSLSLFSCVPPFTHSLAGRLGDPEQTLSFLDSRLSAIDSNKSNSNERRRCCDHTHIEIERHRRVSSRFFERWVVRSTATPTPTQTPTNDTNTRAPNEFHETVPSNPIPFITLSDQ